MMKPKGKGAGIMVTDFIDEHHGFLAFSDEEREQVKLANPSTRKYAREFLEYGENKEGYWNRDKFMEQIKRAVEMAEIKHPKNNGWCHVWVFDHSSCYAVMADDALDVNKMNVNPGGKQRKMRDTVRQGRVQKMNYTLGVPKGMRAVLQERGVDVSGMVAENMKKALAEMEDFKNEKSLIEHFLISKGHVPVILPKFHRELNPVGTTQMLHESPLQVHAPIVTQEHSECVRFCVSGKYSEPLPQSEALHVCLLRRPSTRERT
jgi:hypothetical protein